MSRKLFIIFITLFTGLTTFAQTNKKVKSITLTDVNNAPAILPYVGQKTFVLFYIDPDVQKLSDPLTEAIDNKMYPTNKFGAIGVINCKDTWIPNAVIRRSVGKKQRQYPESVLFLDKKHFLKSTLETGDSDDAMLVYVIGKDASIKYFTSVKSEQKVEAIIQKVLRVIDENLN